MDSKPSYSSLVQILSLGVCGVYSSYLCQEADLLGSVYQTLCTVYFQYTWDNMPTGTHAYIHEHNINHVLPGQGKTNIIQSTMYPEKNRIHL